MVAGQRQRINEIRCKFLHALVDDIGVRFFLALGRQQRDFDEFHPPHRVHLPFCFPERISDLDDTRSSHLIRKREVSVECQPGKTGQGPEGFSRRFLGLPGSNLHLLPQTGIKADRLFCLVQERAKRAAIGDDGGKQRFQAAFIGKIEHIGERLRQFRVVLSRNRRQKRTARLGQKRGGGAIIENREMAGDIGLQRELVQQGFAKSVDGLDFQPARCFQRLGEQPPCFGELYAIRHLAFDGGDAVLEIGIRQRCPFRQPVEHAARHFRCCGLGIGEAEDRRGAAPGQKQADHALGQNMGLAGAGIGRHPGRACGIGGKPLPGTGPVDPAFRCIGGRSGVDGINRHRRLPVPPSTILKRGRGGHIPRHRIAALPAPAGRRNRFHRRAASARIWQAGRSIPLPVR
ncbi:hypothetical protein SRABI05_04815 [Agrobacterium fabrum]|nr:hypothetical protein SRABI05_04815 [Agrobacterium fabrum]